jgi:predicted permease
MEQELDEELRYHLERLIDEEIAAGRTPEEARYLALRAIANIEQRKEECRDTHRVNFIDDLIRDLRYALRILAKTPSFTLVAVLSLALGMGANTATFSLIDAVLIESLPVRDPQRLVLISEKGSLPLSHPLYEYIREHNQPLSGVVAFHAFANWNVSITGETELMTGQLVSGDYFRVLGIHAAAGRLLSPDDDRVPGEHPVAVISYSLWRRRFGSDRGAIGKTIRIYDHPFTVVGVTPPEFFGTQAGFMPEVTIPLMMQRTVLPIGSLLGESSEARWLYVMGRLRPGILEQQARAGLNVNFQHFITARVGDRITPEKRRELTQEGLELTSGSQGLNQLRKRFSFPLRILMGVVGLILLIACTNLANLLLASTCESFGTAARDRDSTGNRRESGSADSPTAHGKPIPGIHGWSARPGVRSICGCDLREVLR